jgi:N-methylhydantoinase A/oxoprolinase/acetone carboxylase beta subunit
MRAPDLQLGVGVGATNTDAVVIDAHHHLVSKAKVPTTPDVRTGIAEAIRVVVAHPDVAPRRVTRAMLGTGHAMTGVLDRHAVRRVAVVRIGGPLTLAVRPLATWPDGLRCAVSTGEAVIDGGAEYDGRPAAPLDEDAIARFLAGVAEDVEAVAVTAVFSPVAPDHELAAVEVVRRELGGAVHVSLSHEIGSVGLLERENATVLNAALIGAAEDLAAALRSALAAERIDAEPFFAQNDGTVMALEHALRFPVLMIGSGPASSMRGAAYLSGVDQGVVADVGWTATEVGMLVNGFPRPSSLPTDVAGVRIDCRMPDVFSLPFGVGSVVGVDADPLTVGPRSVGRDFVEEALVFGGDVPTLADAMVAGGRAELGTRALTGEQGRVLARALVVVDEMLVDAVDRAAVALPASPLVVVGGGSMLVPDDLDGVTEVIRLPDGDVANAIGVAIAPVSGEADRICPNRQGTRARAMEEARVAAFARAVHAGADPARVEVVEVVEIPLSYLLDPAIRIRVKAAGPRS